MNITELPVDCSSASTDTVCGRELWGAKRTKILAIRKASCNETAQPPLYCNLCKNFFIDGQEVQC